MCSSDLAEMQAARNFIVNRRYAEARRVLDAQRERNARWYYLSSLANEGLGPGGRGVPGKGCERNGPQQ